MGPIVMRSKYLAREHLPFKPIDTIDTACPQGMIAGANMFCRSLDPSPLILDVYWRMDCIGRSKNRKMS